MRSSQYQGSLTATLGIKVFISRAQPANPHAYQNSLTPEESGSARSDIRGPSARTSNWILFVRFVAFVILFRLRSLPLHPIALGS
jgi:hypothetical protein